MKKSNPWILPVAILAVLAVGIAIYFFTRDEVEAPVQVEEPADTLPAEPVIEHPVPEVAPTEEGEPLPDLAQSDELIAQSLAEVVGKKPIESFLVPGDVIRHAVASVDNLDAKKLAPRIRAVQPAEGDLAVERQDGRITLSPENYKRYDGLVAALDATSAERLSDVYFRYYPLFQQAYVELGYPNGYFNDRLVQIVDHLLATPDTNTPIELKQPSVYYTFADPDLEGRSAGQKLLLRMGPENREKIKQKLRELRSIITQRQRDQ
jgi:hypothetical protein